MMRQDVRGSLLTWSLMALSLLLVLAPGTPAQEKSVKPGINKSFLDPTLKVEEWVARFEVESREVFAARKEILKAVGPHKGMTVADVGAGTGLFTIIFANEVGPKGWVYAVDIAPAFLQHISHQGQREHLFNITPVLCAENSVSLPPESIDLAFVCDTYHHFEYPKSTLASLHRALREKGTLVVIDLDRIPGKSRQWLLDHVRAGKETVRQEIEAAAFELVEEVKVPGLKENYFLRFQKKETKN
jgi:predicted methyltransferase